MLKSVKKSTKVKVPVRADIAGAFSDIPYYLAKYQIEKGAVVNISLPVYLEISAGFGRNIDPITIEMPDLNEKIVGDLVDLAAQEKNNASQVAMNFIRLFALDSAGLNIKITSKGKIPPASGLGTSSAVGVGIVMALSKLYGLSGINAPEFNYLIEQAMGVTGGKQDYYASFVTGINHFEFFGPEKSLVKITNHYETDSKQYRWLLDCLTVWFSGESRSSGEANARPEDRVKKNPKILEQLASQAKPAFEAIAKMDLEKLKKVVNRDLKNWMELTGGGFYTPGLHQLAEVGQGLGFAHRAGGAGRGGCLLFFGDPKNKPELINKLSKIAGRLVC